MRSSIFLGTNTSNRHPRRPTYPPSTGMWQILTPHQTETQTQAPSQCSPRTHTASHPYATNPNGTSQSPFGRANNQPSYNPTWIVNAPVKINGIKANIPARGHTGTSEARTAVSYFFSSHAQKRSDIRIASLTRSFPSASTVLAIRHMAVLARWQRRL